MANELITADGLAWITTAVERVVKGTANPETVTYTRRTARTYNPTAASAVTETTDGQSLTGSMTTVSRVKDGEAAVSGRLVFHVSVQDFEAAFASGVVPATDDTITRADGDVYEVTKFDPDPLNVLWSIEMKRVGS